MMSLIVIQEKEKHVDNLLRQCTIAKEQSWIRLLTFLFLTRETYQFSVQTFLCEEYGLYSSF